MAAILVVQPTVYDSLSRAAQGVVGVLLGLAAALAVSHFLTLSGWSIARKQDRLALTDVPS